MQRHDDHLPAQGAEGRDDRRAVRLDAERRDRAGSDRRGRVLGLLEPEHRHRQAARARADRKEGPGRRSARPVRRRQARLRASLAPGRALQHRPQAGSGARADPRRLCRDDQRSKRSFLGAAAGEDTLARCSSRRRRRPCFRERLGERCADRDAPIEGQAGFRDVRLQVAAAAGPIADRRLVRAGRKAPGQATKSSAPTITSSVKSNGPLPRGAWRVDLRSGKTIVKSITIDVQ